MIGKMLPMRPLTSAERDGFLIALGCMSTWGRQIAAQSALTGGMPQKMTPVMQMQDRGAFVVDLCRAMEISLGSAPTVEEIGGSVQGQAAAALPATSARADGPGRPSFAGCL